MRIALVYLITTLASTAGDTIIHCGRLIDGYSSTVREKVTVVVDDDRIEAIEQGFLSPAVAP